MSSLWCKYVIFITFVWIWSQVSAHGEIFESNFTLTWNESRKYCEEIGKVLFDATQNNYEASIMKLLKDTNQAWVSARVEFSHFVKVPVCMATSSPVCPNKSFDTDIIHNCLKFCNKSMYAALKDMDCYCFYDSSNLNWSKRCNSACNYDPFHQCGGNDSISLYEKVQYSGCRVINGTYTSEHKLCHMDQVHSIRWKQAKQYCADIGGHIMSSRIPQGNMLENLTYCLGFYRIQMIHKMDALELVTNNTCCAVARREKDVVLIEGDDCRSKHAIICQDDNQERSYPSPQSTDKPIMGERSKSKPTDSKIIYGVIAASALLLVSLVITAIVCIFRRRKVSQERSNGSATNSTIEQHVLLEKQITNPPSKPSRKTHTKKESLKSSYENVAFVCGRQDVAMHQSGYSNFEYDKINLDNAHTQEIDYKDDDTHVYDHGVLNRTEEQYDVMAMSGVMTPMMDDTYDRTTL
ncbi:hypothetical protein ACJMK2_022704 [Sinanodonta woodiana]|uniref:WSC domain-containing protein n=1 Tax=Sinanodonta woodiana TaxID=1069815 RepID=A0ABD3TLV4_SINWO